MYRRDDEKLQCRDGDQANHFRASQGAELEGFPALYRGGFVSPLIRDLESRRDVLTGQSTMILNNIMSYLINNNYGYYCSSTVLQYNSVAVDSLLVVL